MGCFFHLSKTLKHPTGILVHTPVGGPVCSFTGSAALHLHCKQLQVGMHGGIRRNAQLCAPFAAKGVGCANAARASFPPAHGAEHHPNAFFEDVNADRLPVFYGHNSPYRGLPIR